MENIRVVADQVLILFVMIGVGYFCGKKKILSKEAISGITELVLLIITPSVVINSFQRDFEPNLMFGLLFVMLAAVFIHILNIVLAKLLQKEKDQGRERVMQFCIIFSNCGFMALPLQSAILGDLGVFYGAAYIAVFNIFSWSYGLLHMSNDKKNLSIKRMVCNPGVISVLIGLILFFGSVSLPKIISQPLKYISTMNTPLPMLVIGYHLSTASFIEYKKDIKFYLTLVLRLLIAPLLALAGLLLFGLKGDLLVSCIISAATPTAALAVMFAHRYGQDAKLAVSLVSATTICSIFTLPFVVGITQFFA